MFSAEAPTRRIDCTVRRAFEEVLGPLYAAARYERMPLFEHYGSPANEHRRSGPVKQRAALIVARRSAASLEGFAAQRVRFYEEFLAHHRLPSGSTTSSPSCTATSTPPTSWSTPGTTSGSSTTSRAARARPKGLAKLENDLLYLLTPIEDASQLLEALAITRALPLGH